MSQYDRIYGLTGDLAMKAPVRVATTGPVTLSGLQTIDGVVGADQDRILVWQQSSAVDNGIWLMSSGAWSRAPDFDGPRDIINGTRVYVRDGGQYSGAQFAVDADDPITIGSSNIAFSPTSGGGLYSAGHRVSVWDCCTLAMSYGLVDAQPSIQAQLNAMAAIGGGEFHIDGGRWLIDSGDLLIPENVWIVGPWRAFPGMTTLDYSTVQSVFIVNPSHSIYVYGKGTGVQGVGFLRKGLTVPYTLRQAVDAVKQFIGIAIKIGDGVTSGMAQDSYVGHCFFIGFYQAYTNSRNARPRVEYLFGDCWNGLYFNFIADIDYVTRCHWYPFLTYPFSPETSAVSGASNNGAGAVRLTIPSGSVLATGDEVPVWGVVGTTEANGLWTITRIDATHIDLVGSTFTNAYVSGGTVLLSAWRRGTGVKGENTFDWGQLDTIFVGGAQVGFDLSGSQHCVLLNCGYDGFGPSANPTTIGLKIGAGAKEARAIGCKFAAAGQGIVVDMQTAYLEQGGIFTAEGCDFWGNVTNDIHQITGRSKIIGNDFQGDRSGANILVDPNSMGVICTGNQGTGTGGDPISISGNALRLSTIANNDWPDASSVGERHSFNLAQSRMYYTRYGGGSPEIIGQITRGTGNSPTASANGDIALSLSGQIFDGSDFSAAGSINLGARSTPGVGAVPSGWTFSTAPSSGAPISRVQLNEAGHFYPVTDNAYSCGASGVRWSAIWSANGTIQTSDRRQKTDVTNSLLGLDWINSLRPVAYRWIEGGRTIERQVYRDGDGNEVAPETTGAMPAEVISASVPGTRTHYGLLAQEVKASLPDGVDFGGWVLTDKGDPNSPQALRYDQFIAPLIKAMQELTDRVARLESSQ